MLEQQMRFLLKQKKQLEGQLNQVQKSNYMMQGLNNQMEYFKDTLEMADTMSTMVQLQKEKLATMDMDKIEAMGERMDDLKVEMEEIEDVMGRTYEMDDDYDENEYDEMMEELQNEIILEEKMGINNNNNKNENVTNTDTQVNNTDNKLEGLI
mmetsp:Transcript_63716/g.138052  ORF Transcript_63716/g.138052 Transcript_63716/m.138052 type:complete len:153 (+) Transcript_63716:202-660(+)|eukprot:CAMPEP_0116919254 /NCGR_PEP_ID=MMETSP0467-20121206/20269_1 /TAXON_ID=283647 /ORGANISM="Mesodinium pulex, Strain SPMC105" /LENGTH=152 /DNA_ID=CAMNT_0004596783 /DNA_START=198 /DNA_END=656 /DNA_ORIENTATION=-